VSLIDRSTHSAITFVAVVAAIAIAYVAVMWWTITSVNRWDDECQAKFGPIAHHTSLTQCEITNRQERPR
jgi:hypothetical protein